MAFWPCGHIMGLSKWSLIVLPKCSIWAYLLECRREGGFLQVEFCYTLEGDCENDPQTTQMYTCCSEKFRIHSFRALQDFPWSCQQCHGHHLPWEKQRIWLNLVISPPTTVQYREFCFTVICLHASIHHERNNICQPAQLVDPGSWVTMVMYSLYSHIKFNQARFNNYIYTTYWDSFFKRPKINIFVP